jgi:ABC-2 type transport system permease protein
MIFNIFFPLAFIAAFMFSGSGSESINIGVIDNASNISSKNFIDLIKRDPLFEVTQGSEINLKEQLLSGEQVAIIVVPESFDYTEVTNELKLLLDASQVRQISQIRTAIENSLLSVERKLSNTEPMFSLKVEDFKARPQRYVDFLLPGLLAFMLMNLSLGGSGFNIVEYRRRGILKRLFVTPIEPKDFITSIVLARMMIVVIQLSAVLGFAILLLGVRIEGSLFSLYGMIMLSTFIFLCLGFCFGSLAKTQEAIRPLVTSFTFPQLILSGVFFPISSLPDIIQPIAQFLPLSVVVTGLRNIALDGISLFTLDASIFGVIVWAVLSFFLATKYFVWKEVAG